ncbi:major facilitator superfamily domain-containing protein [Phlebopus sp. FC_14]|nr:major facilitator superfamily domain-containing protein [Phlebopus sp. FC_14]
MTRAATTTPNLFNTARATTFLGSILVALGSGTQYIYSAYAPQLGARLHISYTQLNVIGIAVSVGTSTSGPVWGRIVDLKGPRIPLMGAFTCLLLGYSGIKRIYDHGVGDSASIPMFHLTALVLCVFMVGWGCNAGLISAVNTTAKSFPDTARATTIGVVFSAFGLSAFWFSMLANIFFPGDTSAFLLTLAVGTAFPMVIGLFILRPTPYTPPTVSRKPDVATSSSADRDADSSAPLLSHEEEENISRRVSEASSLIEMNQPRSPSRARGDKERIPNVYGKKLWLHSDFHLLFVLLALLSGTGLMYINNVGTISRALYVNANPIIDELEASKWQAAQVSTVSIGNFSGRILIGMLSDLTRNKLRLPRAYCLCIVSFLFIVSQAFAMGVSTVTRLWVASALLGLAYGSLYGLFPAIMIDWFGLAHLSENWGYINFATLFGGNVFSLMFGRNLDSHTSTRGDEPSMLSPRHGPSFLPIWPRGMASDRQCLGGRDCYVDSLRVTLVACTVALGLSVWAGIRDSRRSR